MVNDNSTPSASTPWFTALRPTPSASTPQFIAKSMRGLNLHRVYWVCQRSVCSIFIYIANNHLSPSTVLSISLRNVLSSRDCGIPNIR